MFFAFAAGGPPWSLLWELMNMVAKSREGLMELPRSSMSSREFSAILGNEKE